MHLTTGEGSAPPPPPRTLRSQRCGHEVTPCLRMIYAGGPVSGAHNHPAVTLAAWMRGVTPTNDVAPFMAAQVVGAVLAWLAVFVLKGDAPVEAATV